eukprot:149136-Pyramimonas_sp.AAC.1
MSRLWVSLEVWLAGLAGGLADRARAGGLASRARWRSGWQGSLWSLLLQMLLLLSALCMRGRCCCKCCLCTWLEGRCTPRSVDLLRCWCRRVALGGKLGHDVHLGVLISCGVGTGELRGRGTNSGSSRPCVLCVEVRYRVPPPLYPPDAKNPSVVGAGVD